MNKLTKTAKNLDHILKIVSRTLSILGGIVIAVSITLLLFTDDFAEMVATTITLGAVNFDISAEYLANTNITSIYFVLELLLMTVSLGVICYIIHIIRNTLQPMIQNLPFSNTVSTNLRKLAWVSLIGGGIFSVINFASDFSMYKMYDFETLFVNNQITGCSIDCVFDLSFLIFFGILYLLSYVFQYGEVLQQQSDETL